MSALVKLDVVNQKILEFAKKCLADLVDGSIDIKQEIDSETMDVDKQIINIQKEKDDMDVDDTEDKEKGDTGDDEYVSFFRRHFDLYLALIPTNQSLLTHLFTISLPTKLQIQISKVIVSVYHDIKREDLYTLLRETDSLLALDVVKFLISDSDTTVPVEIYKSDKWSLDFFYPLIPYLDQVLQFNQASILKGLEKLLNELPTTPTVESLSHLQTTLQSTLTVLEPYDLLFGLLNLDNSFAGIHD